MARYMAADLRVAWVAMAVLVVGPLLGAAQQPSPAPLLSLPPLDDPTVANVSSGLELAAALNDTTKTWAILQTSIQVNESDWANYSVPILRYTNFTISGPPGPETSWPVLGLGFVKGKIRLENNTALTLQYVVVRDFRATPLGQSPGFDIVASSTTEANAVISMQNATLMLRICVPRNIQGEIMSSIARPANLPGVQISVSNVNQANCTNSLTAALVSRCWPDAGVYKDVAVAGFDIDAFGRATATRYALYMRDVPYLCEKQMQEECVSALGPLGCFLFMFPRTPVPPSPSLNLSAPNAAKANTSLPAIVGGVVGGVLAAVVAVLVALFVVRRRRRREKQRRAAEENAKLSAPSVEGNGTGTGNGSGKHPLGGPSPPASLGDPPSTNAAKLTVSQQASSVLQQPSTGRNIILPSGVGTCVLSSTDVDASSPLVIVTPFTPHRSDLKLDVQCDTEVKLLPIIRGKGSYGRVVEGLYGGQRVAVKLVVDVDEWSGPTDSLVNSFAQEVEVLGRCQHPNIVRLLAACLKPPRLCLVMELMDTSLERVVHGKSGELLPLTTVLHIAADIARGLAYLHPTIVHRDLKPGNVLLGNTESLRPIAKLTDFGLSRLRSTVLVTRHPEAGTPAYMAPEAFDASNYVITHKADIYALGVILWEMLTGSVPWDGCSMVAIAYSITVRHHRLPLSKLDASRCPPKLRKLIHQCWDPDPQRRPAAAELVKQLTLVLQLVQGEQEAPSSTGSMRSNTNVSVDNTRIPQAPGGAASGNGGAGAGGGGGGGGAEGGGGAGGAAAVGPGQQQPADPQGMAQGQVAAAGAHVNQFAVPVKPGDAAAAIAVNSGAGGGTPLRYGGGSGTRFVDRVPQPGAGLSNSGGAAVAMEASSSLSSTPAATSLSQVSGSNRKQPQLLETPPRSEACAAGKPPQQQQQPLPQSDLNAKANIAGAAEALVAYSSGPDNGAGGAGGGSAAMAGEGMGSDGAAHLPVFVSQSDT